MFFLFLIFSKLASLQIARGNLINIHPIGEKKKEMNIEGKNETEGMIEIERMIGEMTGIVIEEMTEIEEMIEIGRMIEGMTEIGIEGMIGMINEMIEGQEKKGRLIA